jgi:hypothetical protein
MKFGKALHGHNIYTEVSALKPREGQKVRITIPGVASFVLPIHSITRDGSVTVKIGDTVLFLADRANGAISSGHDWILEFEEKEPNRLKFAPWTVVQHRLGSTYVKLPEGEGWMNVSLAKNYPEGSHVFRTTIEDPKVFKRNYELISGPEPEEVFE